MIETAGKVVKPISYRGYHVVLSSGMLMMFGTMGMWSLARLQPQLMAELGWNAATISGAVTTNLILMSLMGPVIGYLIDRITPRWTALIGSIITGTAICLLSTAREVWQFYLFYGVMLSIGLSLSYSVPGLITIRRWFMRRAASMMGLVFVASSVGIFLITLLTSASLSAFGLRWTFVLIGVMVGSVMALFSLLLRKDPATVGQVVDNVPYDPEFVKKREEFAAFSEEWSVGEAIRTWQFWSLAIALMFTYFGCLGLIHHYITWASMEVGLPMKTAVWLYAFLFALFSLAGRILGGLASDWMMPRWGRKPILYFGIAGMIVAYLIAITLGKGAVGAGVFAATFGFCYGATLSPISMLLGDIFGVANVAHLQGWLGPIMGLGVGLSPFVFGAVFTATGSYSGAFMIAIGSLAVALVALFVLNVPKKKAPQEP
ncbi:MAG: MFS transporter [Deltaproteobacteria bacterium]|nr:MFS transporter [Deltaproteobacteria bacterium]